MMKTSNAEEIRLKGVEIGFFTPFFVLEAQWWNIHTQFNEYGYVYSTIAIH